MLKRLLFFSPLNTEASFQYWPFQLGASDTHFVLCHQHIYETLFFLQIHFYPRGTYEAVNLSGQILCVNYVLIYINRKSNDDLYDHFLLHGKGTAGYIFVIYWNTWGHRYRGNCPIWYSNAQRMKLKSTYSIQLKAYTVNCCLKKVLQMAKE